MITKHQEPTTINLYFGEQHLETLSKFDELKYKLRRSRTQTIDFLMTYFETNENQKSITRVFYWKPITSSMRNTNPSIKEPKTIVKHSEIVFLMMMSSEGWLTMKWLEGWREYMKLTRERSLWKVSSVIQLTWTWLGMSLSEDQHLNPVPRRTSPQSERPRPSLRQTGRTSPMRRKIERENKVVFFEGEYPTCLGVPHLMRKHFQDFTHQVLSYKRFQELELPLSWEQGTGW